MTVARRGVDAVTSLVTNAWVYDRAQEHLSGLGELRSRVRRQAAAFEGSVVDVGAGTGNFADVFPDSVRYVATDVDPAKIARFEKKYPELEAHVADGTSLPFPDGAFDYALCVDVSHHLTDSELEALFAEVRRVVTREFVFLDALWVPSSFASRALWSIDRGRHPRERAALLAALGRHFTVEEVEDFRLTHRYVLVRASR